MKTIYKILKWIFEAVSCALCLVLMLHFGIKDESGSKLLPKDALIAVTVSLAVCVLIYAVFEFLYKREKSKDENRDDNDERNG